MDGFVQNKRQRRQNIKQHIMDGDRSGQPGQCNKFLHLVIDPEFLESPHGAVVLSRVCEFNLKYEIKPQTSPRVITFYRRTPTQLSTDGALTANRTDENYLVHLISGEEMVRHVKERNLLATMQSIQQQYPGKAFSLLVFQLVAYCRNNRGCVGRKETEQALTELQLFADISHHLPETAEQVANFVAQLAKSIAELPYKRQQQDKYSHEQLYLGNEKKGCVRVEGTAGLRQLYQNQLIKIPSVTLEVAEAIIETYPTLNQLLNAFRFASDGPNLLADIAVRRTGGPVTTSIRRIGPELSKKISLHYSTINAKQEI